MSEEKNEVKEWTARDAVKYLCQFDKELKKEVAKYIEQDGLATIGCFIEDRTKQIQAAKEENEKLRNLLGKPYKRRIDLENNKLTQQNKQMRENINNIKNLCNEDWEDMTVDKFQNQLLQALKGVE